LQTGSIPFDGNGLNAELAAGHREGLKGTLEGTRAARNAMQQILGFQVAKDCMFVYFFRLDQRNMPYV